MTSLLRFPPRKHTTLLLHLLAPTSPRNTLTPLQPLPWDRTSPLKRTTAPALLPPPRALLKPPHPLPLQPGHSLPARISPPKRTTRPAYRQPPQPRPHLLSRDARRLPCIARGTPRASIRRVRSGSLRGSALKLRRGWGVRMRERVRRGRWRGRGKGDVAVKLLL